MVNRTKPYLVNYKVDPSEISKEAQIAYNENFSSITEQIDSVKKVLDTYALGEAEKAIYDREREIDTLYKKYQTILSDKYLYADKEKVSEIEKAMADEIGAMKGVVHESPIKDAQYRQLMLSLSQKETMLESFKTAGVRNQDHIETIDKLSVDVATLKEEALNIRGKKEHTPQDGYRLAEIKSELTNRMTSLIKMQVLNTEEATVEMSAHAVALYNRASLDPQLEELAIQRMYYGENSEIFLDDPTVLLDDYAEILAQYTKEDISRISKEIVAESNSPYTNQFMIEKTLKNDINGIIEKKGEAYRLALVWAYNKKQQLQKGMGDAYTAKKTNPIAVSTLASAGQYTSSGRLVGDGMTSGDMFNNKENFKVDFGIDNLEYIKISNNNSTFTPDGMVAEKVMQNISATIEGQKYLGQDVYDYISKTIRNYHGQESGLILAVNEVLYKNPKIDGTLLKMTMFPGKYTKDQISKYKKELGLAYNEQKVDQLLLELAEVEKKILSDPKNAAAYQSMKKNIIATADKNGVAISADMLHGKNSLHKKFYKTGYKPWIDRLRTKPDLTKQPTLTGSYQNTPYTASDTTVITTPYANTGYPANPFDTKDEPTPYMITPELLVDVLGRDGQTTLNGVPTLYYDSDKDSYEIIPGREGAVQDQAIAMNNNLRTGESSATDTMELYIAKLWAENEGKILGTSTLTRDNFQDAFKKYYSQATEAYILSEVSEKLHYNSKLRLASANYNRILEKGGYNQYQSDQSLRNMPVANYIKEIEGGFKPNAIADGPYWQMGYGFTTGTKEGDSITKTEADRRMDEMVSKYNKEIDSTIKVPLTQLQRNITAGLIHNLGSLSAAGEFVKALNDGNMYTAGKKLRLYTKAKNKDKVLVENDGLYARRKHESDLWLQELIEKED